MVDIRSNEPLHKAEDLNWAQVSCRAGRNYAGNSEMGRYRPATEQEVLDMTAGLRHVRTLKRLTILHGDDLFEEPC